MQLTTKGRFAVTAMMDIALHGSQEPVTLACIREFQKISLHYQILRVKLWLPA
jgi:Rrf2 family iron-sulfur cluster assembly transcriptional regulator